MAKPDDPQIFQLLTEIGIIEQLARNQLERALPAGLKMSQFIVLNHLARLGGEWSPARLANAMQVTKGAMTNTVNRLEDRKLVKVVADPSDGRGKLVTLTEDGKQARTRCLESVGPMMADMSNELSDKDVATALPVLEKIRKNLDALRG